MFRRNLLLLVLSVLCSGSSLGMAQKSRLPTMLVVPAHYAQLQIGFDIANRYNTLLVSYQANANSSDPLLHVWDGNKWIQISMQEYRTASFLSVRPNRVILIGDEHLLPRSLVAASDWSPLVMDIPSNGTADIVNSIGKVVGFRSRDWKWFASRYSLDIEDLNANARASSWYDRSSASLYKEEWIRDTQVEPQAGSQIEQVDNQTSIISKRTLREMTPTINRGESVPQSFSTTNGDIVMDDIPSVSDVQQNVSVPIVGTATTADFNSDNLSSGWREQAAAADIPMK